MLQIRTQSMLPVTEILSHVTGHSQVKIAAGHKIRFMNDQPPVVVWNITNQCNMACPHCYSAAKFKADSNELTLPQAFNVIDNLQEAGIKILIISGGEPLMRNDWPEIIRYARKAQMSTHLSTNGVGLNETTCNQLKDLGVHYVGVSIDGLAEFNNKYRNFNQGFEQALTGIQNVLKTGIMAGMRITISSQNEDQVFPLLNIAKNNHVSRFYISHLVYGGRGIGFSKQDQERKKKAAQMTKLFDYALKVLDDKNQPLIVTGGNDADCVALYLFIKTRLGDKAANMARELLEKRGGNSAGEKMINIDHLGNVHPDQFWRSVSPANILDHPLNDILKMGIFSELPDRINKIKGRCSNCIYKSMCRGSHRERAQIVYSDMWAEDPACYISDIDIYNNECLPAVQVSRSMV